MTSHYGKILNLTLFGESHGPAVGMCLENFPAGFAPNFAELRSFLERRAPGRSSYTTTRREADIPEFLSGIKNGRTTGTPIAAILRNSDAQAWDYVNQPPRPSHADLPAYQKLGPTADLSGGGAFSGRLTAALCVAGGLCLQYLAAHGIRIGAHALQIGTARDRAFDPLAPCLPVRSLTLDNASWEQMHAEIQAAAEVGDSVGGVIECAVTGLPTGLGEPPFGGLENRLSQIMFAIPAVKGVEFGSGFACAALRGSEHNDPYYRAEDGTIRTRTNHAGGILGGMSTGMPLLLRAAIKPTPSIAAAQESVNYDGSPATVAVRGRHDPCIVPRAVPCVEAAAAIAVLDAIMEANALLKEG